MKPPPTILALDVASTTGFCHGVAGGPIFFGSHRMSPPGAGHAEVQLAFWRWTADMIGAISPKIIAVEAPLDPRGIPKTTNPETFKLLIALAESVAAVAWGRGIYDVRYIPPSEVRRHFIGKNPKRDEAKRLTMRQCKLLGHNVMTDDQADAIALHDFMSGKLRQADLLERAR